MCNDTKGSVLERGYLDALPRRSSPQSSLADLLNKHAMTYHHEDPFVHPEKLRRLIVQHWSKVSMLAHQIHNEETK